MNNIILKILLTALLILLVVPYVNGEGTTGAQFLEIGVGARACAMGGAFGAAADDASAIYWNPAGMVQSGTNQVMFSQNFWLMDMTHQFAAGVYKHKLGTFGASFYYSSSGDIPKVEDFVKVGEYSAYDMAISLAYANSLVDCLSYGVGLKYINQKIEEESASTFAVDIGAIYDIWQLAGLKIGLAVQNIGPEIKFIEEGDKLPLNIKLGVAYQKDNYVIAADLNRTIDNDMTFGFGGEYVIRKILALRAGYNSLHTVSFGCGLFWKKFAFSYTLAPNENLDSSHRISLEVQF